MERKIASLKAKVLSRYEEKIDDLLSVCESPIERLFLLYLLDTISKVGGLKAHVDQLFSNIEFVEDVICYDAAMDFAANTPAIDPPRFGITSRERIEKHRYRFCNEFYEKIIGVKAKFTYSEPVEKGSASVFRELRIYPQCEVDIAGSIYRIDIGILLNRVQNEQSIETRKIAIECDGHAFHSTKEQKECDDRRSRKLQSDGWKVLRYSGSELYGIAGDEEFKQVFAEIVKVFYAF